MIALFMRLFLFVSVLLSTPFMVQAQDMPLFLGSGVRVDYHPNNFPEYKFYAPEISKICAPEEMDNSCGRVWWSSRQQPPLGKRYVTQIPAAVRLQGPSRNAWWAPFSHCMTRNDADKKRQSFSPPGVQCVTILKRAGEYMEWVIGGTAEGIDHAIPGTYTGNIPFTVTGPGTRWELDIPVTYTVHKKQNECQLRYVPSDRTIVFDEEFSGFTGEKTKDFSFEIRSLLPRNSVSWTVTVNTPESSDDSFTLTGVAVPASGSASDEWENVTVTFTGSDFETLPPNTYVQNWEIIVMCPQ